MHSKYCRHRNSIIIKRGAKSVPAQFDTWDKLGNGYETVLFYTKNSNYRINDGEMVIAISKVDEKIASCAGSIYCILSVS